MFSFEYIAPFWLQQEAQEPGFLIRKDRRGNLCIQRGDCAVFDQIYDNLQDHFQEMCPIFKNIDISRDDIGEFMKKYAVENDIMNNPGVVSLEAWSETR